MSTLNKKVKIFIDGSEGTTGLRIYERFQGRDDIELLKIENNFCALTEKGILLSNEIMSEFLD